MPAVAWVTVAISAVILGLAAIALLRVILHLRAVHATLSQVIGGVAVVADRTSTVPARLTSVNANLKPVRDFCESV